MEPYYVIALALLALLAGLLAARLQHQSRRAEAIAKEASEHARQAEGDINSLRMAKHEMERRFAAEEQKATRIPELEKALEVAAGRIDKSHQARMAAESQTAVAQEAVTRLEAALADGKGRLTAAEQGRAEMLAQIDILKDQIGQMEQSQGVKAETVAQNEQAVAELRQRLGAAEAARDQAGARAESATQAKTELEATLARVAAQIQEKTHRADALEEELRQARAKSAAHLELATQAKSGLETALARAAAQIEEKAQRVAALEEELRQSRVESAAHLDSARQAKSGSETTLATAAAQIEEKAQRVAALEEELRQARAESAAHLDSARQAKSGSETALARAAAQIEEKAQRVAALEEELRQSRAESAAHLDAAAQAKSGLEATLARVAAQIEEKAQRVAALEEELRQVRAETEAARGETGEKIARLAALQEVLDQERKHGAEKLALLTEAREQMTQEFRQAAEEAIRRQGENVSQENKALIEVVLTPLRERLSEFQQGLLGAHDESTKERLALADQIRRLSDNSALMASETQRVAFLLKGKAEGLGAWGEVLLSSILERSGLREGEDYVFRESYSPDGSQRLRPDVVISLPGDQRVVIDSKVPLAAFEAYVNSQDDAESAAQLAHHTAALAGHIKALVDRGPPPVAESRRDYTVMFVPVEGALAAALRQDSDLTGLAVENNIALATPGTLMMALRSVANVWQAERRNRRAEAIAEQAGKLYDGFVGYLGDMELLGDHLVRARHAYEEALSKLASGRDNLIGQVEALKEMGAKSTKPLPRISAGERRFEASSANETGPGLEEPQVQPLEPPNEDTIAGM
jgi:DNA recombination protein RmuC